MAVFRAVNAAHAVGMQLTNFSGNNHTAAAAKYLDVFTTALAQQVDHVFEIFDVAALIGADGNALCIFLQSRSDHLIDRTVVAQMNHLSAHALKNTAHDVDGSVMAVEQTGGSHETHFMGGAVFSECFEFCRQVGHGFVPEKNKRAVCRATQSN